MMLIGHIQKNDSTATIIHIALGTAQQQLGISIPFLESNFTKYSFLLEHYWLKTVWNFLFEIKGSITIPNVWQHQSPYEHNTCILDRVCELDLPIQTTQKFNLCRLFKEVHFLTEIYDSRQKHMHPEILRPAKRPFKYMKWPCITVPKSYWRVWEAVLKTLYMSASVSGFFPGQMIRMHLFRFLQSADRKHLLSKIGRNQYHVFMLDAFSRNK